MLKKLSPPLLMLPCLIATSVHALETENNFSPYADLTINTQWDSHYQDMEPVDLFAISQSTGVKSFHLAFITDAGNCQPAWGAQSAYSINSGWASHLTDKLRANNLKTIVSFGGASGNDVSKACDKSQLISTYEQVIKQYQPDGLDFDIENGTADIHKIMTTLPQIQSAHPNLKISFTLAVMPEGLGAEGQEVVKQAVANHIAFTVNIMAMDYGPAYANDMGEYAIQAATNTYRFLKELYPEKSNDELWGMIEVTPMIGVNDVSVEQFTLSNVDTLKKFVRQNHLGGMAMWSIARDNPCADAWASPICSGKNLQKTSYEFVKRFIQD